MVVIIIVNIFILGYTAMWLAGRDARLGDPIIETSLDHGVELPQDVVEHLQQTAGDVPAGDSVNFLLLALIGEDVAPYRLRYLDSLARRFSGIRMEILFVHPSSSSMRSWRSRIDPSVTSIVDTDLDIHRALHINPNHNHGGLVVLADRRTVDFRVLPIPAEDELRQLVEKYAVGRIDYATASPALRRRFALGRPFPAIDAVQVWDGESVRFGPAEAANLTVIVFGAGCSSCQLDGFVQDVRGLLNRVHSRSDFDETVVALFDNSFEREVIRAYQQRGDLPGLAYIAAFDDDVTFNRIAADQVRPLVVVTDVRGEVRAVGPLRLD